MMKRLCLLAAILIAGVIAGPAGAQDADTLRHLKPYLGPDSAVIGRLDVGNVDVEQAEARLRKAGVDADSIDVFKTKFAKTRERLLAAGAKHVYFTNTGGLLQPELLGVVPSNDAAAVVRIVADTPLKARVVGDVVLIGTAKALEHAGKGGGNPSPDWAKVLAKLEAYPSYAAFSPPTVLRRIVLELQPNLPAELGGGPLQPLVDGVLWGAVGFDLSAKPNVEFVLQTKDEAAAKEVETVLDRGIALLKNAPAMQMLPFAAKLLDDHRPKRAGDRFVLARDAAAIGDSLIPFGNFGGPREGSPRPVDEQFQADRHRDAQLSRHLQGVSAAGDGRQERPSLY